MKFRLIAFALVLVLPLLLPAFARHSASSSLRATATVTEPIGILDLRQVADELAIPVIAEYAQRWFLYLPRQSNALVQLDGEPVENVVTGTDEIVTLLDLSHLATSRANSDSLVVTIIYSEN